MVKYKDLVFMDKKYIFLELDIGAIIVSELEEFKKGEPTPYYPTNFCSCHFIYEYTKENLLLAYDKLKIYDS